MLQIFETYTLKTSAGIDILDITSKVEETIRASGIKDGVVTITVPGSTASITTIEYEDGVIEDLKKTIEELIPSNRTYAHDSRWGDGNGYSHVRAAILKPSLTIPIANNTLLTGTWQQIVLCDFDNRPRNRKVIIHIMGE